MAITPVFYECTMDLSTPNSFVQIPTVQGDGSNVRYVKMSLLSNGTPYQISSKIKAYLVGSKSDGTGVMHECTIEDNCVVFDVTSEMSSAEGRSIYTIMLNDAELKTQIKSFPFYIVSSPVCDPSRITSSDDYQALSSLLSDGEAVRNQANVVKQNYDASNKLFSDIKSECTKAKQDVQNSKDMALQAIENAKSLNGLQPFSKTFPEKTTLSPTDLIPINEADGTAKCINYATMDRLLNSWDDVNLFKGTVSSSNYARISLIPNDNGEYTINGTPTGDVYFNPIGGAIEIQNGLYYAKAESEASTSTHEVMIMKKNKTTGASSYVANIVSDQYLTISDADEFAYYCYIVVKKDLVCNDLKIMPNLVLIEAADGNKNNKRIVEEIDTNMGIVGNLIPEQEIQTIENNGIIFDIASDGSFTINGTATAQINQLIGENVSVQKGNIIVISGAENFRDNSSIQANDHFYFNGISSTSGNPTTYRTTTSNLTNRTFEITKVSTIAWKVLIQAGHTYENFKVYPSIHIIGKKEVDTAYTNKELGDRIENCRDKLEFLTDLVDCNALVDNPANKNIMRVQYADHASNAPTNSNYRVLTINQTQSFASQIAIDVNRNNRMFIRSKVGGTWSDWEKLVTATELAAKKPKYTNILTTNEIIPTTFTSYECADFSQCDAFLVCAMLYGAISATIEVPMVYFQFTGESNSIILKNPKNDIVYRVAKGADNTHIIVKAETEGTSAEYKIRVYGITY